MTTTGAPSPQPGSPPPPPPPSSPPPPPPPPGARTFALPPQATSVIAMVKNAWAEGMSSLNREAGRVGLGTESRTGSVWPVIGFGFLVVALISDRVHSSHAVPVRWIVVLLLLGLVVVAGQLRGGGRLPALSSAPAFIGSPIVLTAFALLLAAQQLDFLSLGVTQIAWFCALVCVAVPIVREMRRQGPPPPLAAEPLTALRQSAPLLGAVLVAVAVVVGWLPDQYGPGWFWVVVLLLAAGLAAAAEIAKLPQHRLSLPAPVTAAAFWVLTALVAGVAVVSARLQVTSVLWLAAAYVLGREAWRRLAAEGGELPVRSRAGVALVALGIAVLSLFAQSNSQGSSGYFMGGLSYDPYAYGADAGGYYYNPTEYYIPGYYYAGSGRGQPFTIPVVAGLVAMAGVVRRRRMTKRLRVGAAVVAAGAVLWAFVENDAGYFSVWVFLIAVLVAGVATATNKSADADVRVS